jgi:HD-like signal output (HDOD) protein
MPSVREDLKEKLKMVAYLPTMPQVLFRVEQALKDENSAAGKIASIIREDPALTTSVLRVANSVIYRGKLSSKISVVPQAVARLGFTEVRRICLTSALIRVFADYGKGIDHAAFWQHSVTVATATRLFQRYTRAPALMSNDELEDAFVAGLLHDVGILVMDQFFPEPFAKVRAYAEAELMPLARAETEILGIQHGEIGGLLLAEWNLPDRVVNAVTWHHDPDRAREANRRVAQLVHLADFVCVNQSVGDTLEGLYDGFSPGAWHDLGLSVDEAPQMLEDLKEERVRSDAMSSAA